MTHNYARPSQTEMDKVFGKPKSVRSQRSKQEHMASLKQNIDNMVFAAEVACRADAKSEYHCTLGKKCPFRSKTDHYMSCNIDAFRMILGDHTPQHDIGNVELSKG